MKRLLCMIITVIMLLGSMQALVFAQTHNDAGPMAAQQEERPDTPIEPQGSKMSAMATNFIDWSFELFGINEYGIDINSNRLFDYLRVDLILNILADRIYNIQSTLYTEDMDMQLGYIETNPALNIGFHSVFLDFNGADINRSEANGPYMIRIDISDGNYTESVLFRTKAYSYTNFELYSIEMPPVLGPIGNKTVKENETLQFTVSAHDPNGDAITYSVENLP